MKKYKTRAVRLIIAILLITTAFINCACAKSPSLKLRDYIGYYIDVNYILNHNEPGYKGTDTQHLIISNSSGGDSLELGFGWGGIHWKSGSVSEYFYNGCMYAGFGFDENLYKYNYNTKTKILTVEKDEKQFVYRRVKPFADDYIDGGKTHVYTYPEGKYNVGNKPSQTILSSVKPGKKKKMTVKWKRNSNGTGYQIQYSTDRAFTKGNKIVTISGSESTSKTIKGLKKKKYYIRIRTYSVKSGKKYFSGWSKIKRIQIQ